MTTTEQDHRSLPPPGTAIVDLDLHLSDGEIDRWEPFLDAASLAALSHWRGPDGVVRLRIGEREYPKAGGGGRGSHLGLAASDNPPPTAWDRYLEATGVGTGIVQPGFVGLAAPTLPDGELRRSLAEGHNRRARDFAAAHPSLVPATLVMAADPEWSIAQLEEARHPATPRVAVARPTDISPRPFATAGGRRLLEYLAAESVLLCLHSGTGYHHASPVADLFDSYTLTHLFSHPIEAQVALADLVTSGAFRAGLRVAILEAGCGWVPWFWTRLAEHLRRLGPPEAAGRLSAVQSGQVFFSIEPDDPDLPSYLRARGTTGLVFGSDFPHWDAAAGDPREALVSVCGADQAEEILSAHGQRAVRGAGA